MAKPDNNVASLNTAEPPAREEQDDTRKDEVTLSVRQELKKTLDPNTRGFNEWKSEYDSRVNFPYLERQEKRKHAVRMMAETAQSFDEWKTVFYSCKSHGKEILIGKKALEEMTRLAENTPDWEIDADDVPKGSTLWKKALLKSTEKANSYKEWYRIYSQADDTELTGQALEKMVALVTYVDWKESDFTNGDKHQVLKKRILEGLLSKFDTFQEFETLCPDLKDREFRTKCLNGMVRTAQTFSDWEKVHLIVSEYKNLKKIYTSSSTPTGLKEIDEKSIEKMIEMANQVSEWECLVSYLYPPRYIARGSELEQKLLDRVVKSIKSLDFKTCRDIHSAVFDTLIKEMLVEQMVAKADNYEDCKYIYNMAHKNHIRQNGLEGMVRSANTYQQWKFILQETMDPEITQKALQGLVNNANTYPEWEFVYNSLKGTADLESRVLDGMVETAQFESFQEWKTLYQKVREINITERTISNREQFALRKMTDHVKTFAEWKYIYEELPANNDMIPRTLKGMVETAQSREEWEYLSKYIPENSDFYAQIKEGMRTFTETSTPLVHFNYIKPQ